MNIFTLIFGKKENINNKEVIENMSLAEILARDSKFNFGKAYTRMNASKLVRYWYDNFEEWENEYDEIEYNGMVSAISSIKVMSSYKNVNDFDLTLFPNCNLWFQLKSTSPSNLSCKSHIQELTRYSRSQNDDIYLEYNRYDTPEKVYNFLYEMTVNMKLKTTDSFKLKKYCKNNNISLDNNSLKFYSINDGEYYIYTTRYEYSKQFMISQRANRSPYYYSTRIYKFSDWSNIDHTDYKTIYEAFGENPKVEECEDPKAEHWKHFTKLEIKNKTDFINKCKEFVESVYLDEIEYNDLMSESKLESPYPKIKCFSTMKTFCDAINKTIPYNEHDINTAIAKINEELGE